MSPPTTTRGAKRFLLVEDEMLLAMMMEDVLAECGYEVRKAAHLRDAMELAGKESFDGAVLDVNLGGEQVFPVAAALRERNVPFVFSSGYGEQSIPLEYSDYAVLQKPYRLEQFIAAVRKLLVPAESKHDA